MEESSIRADDDCQDWVLSANLETPEAEHTRKHPQHNVPFLRAVDEFVHMVAVFHDLWGDYV